MKYLFYFENYQKNEGPVETFEQANADNVFEFSENNGFFESMYSELVLQTSSNKKDLLISKKRHPISANGGEMKEFNGKPLLYSYDAKVGMKTNNGVFSMYFGCKGSAPVVEGGSTIKDPGGKPIPNFVEFKKVYNSEKDFQDDLDNFQRISQNKFGFNFEVTQDNLGWSFRLENLHKMMNPTWYKKAEQLTRYITKMFK
jgi:hypothetical protein